MYFRFNKKRKIPDWTYKISISIVKSVYDSLINYDVYWKEKAKLLQFYGNLLADGEEHVVVFHVVFAKSIRLQRAGRVVARVATEVGRCWTLSLILIDLLHRPTPFTRVARRPSSHRISVQSNAPEWRNVAEEATKQPFSPPSLSPSFSFPDFCPVQSPLWRALTGVQQQFVTQKLLSGEKSGRVWRGARTGTKRRSKKFSKHFAISHLEQAGALFG